MSTTFLYNSSAISTQSDLITNGFLKNLVPIEKSKTLVEPDYKNFIKPMMIRRMSKATKMSIACAFKCLQDSGEEQPDAIIVGTGLGSLADTEKFLKVSTSIEKKILPPTSFIQSGHNTIAGQIALLLINDCYNMTHVQQALSFEHALLDSMLSISEGKKLVLTGAVDEHTPLLDDLANRFGINEDTKDQLSEGAGYFVLGPNRSKANAEIVSTSISNYDSLTDSISSFLRDNELSDRDIEKGFIAFSLSDKFPVDLDFELLCYSDYSGRHFSSSAFGLHIANRYIQEYNMNDKYVLIINVASNNKLGLILLKGV